MISIEQVTQSNWSSLEELFLASPECSECWCMNHRSDPKNCPTGNKAKDALCSEILAGRAHGLLALADGVPAGWCAVDAIKTQIGHDYYLETENARSSDAWMIHCLYVDPRQRGKGISRQLVEAASSVAKENGASAVLAFPIPENSAGKFPKDIAEFSGRLSTFIKLGFELCERLNDFYQVVSRPLKAPNSSLYTFRSMVEEDLPLLFRWASEPHVKQWWDTEKEWTDFRVRYLDNINSKDSFPHIVSFNQEPIGYINYWTVESDPNFKSLFPAGAVGTDQFIGEPSMIGQGHGHKFVRAFTDQLLANPKIPVVMTDPDRPGPRL